MSRGRNNARTRYSKVSGNQGNSIRQVRSACLKCLEAVGGDSGVTAGKKRAESPSGRPPTSRLIDESAADYSAC